MSTTAPSAPKPQREPEEEISEQDLQAAIQRAFPGSTDQMVIHQISDHTYRVNWHDNSGGEYITASKFLRVNATPDGIQIEDLSIGNKTKNTT